MPQDGSNSYVSSLHQHPGHFEEGIEPVPYQDGQYPEHYAPPSSGPEKQVFYSPEQQQLQQQQQQQYGPPAGQPAGMKKRTVLILVGVGIVLVGLIIGLGAGLGTQLAQEKSTTQ